MSINLDIALDRTPDAPALILDGLRLSLKDHAAFEHLEEVFDLLVTLKHEVESRRRWAAEMRTHLRRLPTEPDYEV